MIALRALARYAVPLALATAIVATPIAWLAWRTPVPTSLPTANAALLRAWIVAGTGWMLALVLVAAAAPLVRSLEGGTPLTQLRAIRAAFANLARMLLPCAAAIGAILVGGLALVVPALALFVLLSLTGASTERGMPAPLVDSVQRARAQWKPIAVIAIAMLAVEIAAVVAAWKLHAVPIRPKLTPAQWATYADVPRIAAVVVAIVSPIAATLLAAVRR